MFSLVKEPEGALQVPVDAAPSRVPVKSIEEPAQTLWSLPASTAANLFILKVTALLAALNPHAFFACTVTGRLFPLPAVPETVTVIELVPLPEVIIHPASGKFHT